jgi:ferredoxin
MQTGPRVRQGFDLALTEIIDGDTHVFVVEVGSEAGEEVLRESSPSEASGTACRQAEEAVDRASLQTRKMDTIGIRDLLYDNFEHPRWDDVASRCLSCANCTMVCPTCFCTTVEDVSDVSGNHAERWRKWDSCFTQSFSYIHGGSVRTSAKSRYRQWMTHKLASWIDQFGTSGCVGCGRCITWCPVGIDITEEVRAIRENPSHPGPLKGETSMESLEPILCKHAFLERLEADYLKLLVGCASNVRFSAGAYIFRQGEEASHFYLIRQGRVALEIHAPQRPPIVIETLDGDDILGWSWLIPPYLWRFRRPHRGQYARHCPGWKVPSCKVRRGPRLGL